MADSKVTQLHTPTTTPPPPPLTPSEKLIERARGIDRVDIMRATAENALKNFDASGDEKAGARIEEIVGELGEILEDLAVGK